MFFAAYFFPAVFVISPAEGVVGGVKAQIGQFPYIVSFLASLDLKLYIREGFKTPSHGKCPLGGYPPPPPGGLRTRFFCKVSEKNLTDKGGTPPPLTDAKSKNFSPQAAFFGVFHPKNTVFDPKS